MRVHVVNVMRGDPEIAGHTLDRFAEFARGVEARGFHGLWMTDSFGRGRPTLDPDSDRVIFHCKASAKTPRVGHENAIAVRAEFHPRAMRVHGIPDL